MPINNFVGKQRSTNIILCRSKPLIEKQTTSKSKKNKIRPIKKVNEGSDLVTRTNEAFTQVADSSAKVGELVAEIAAASEEMTAQAGQMKEMVGELVAMVGGSSIGGVVKKNQAPAGRLMAPKNDLHKRLAAASPRTRVTSKPGKFHQSKRVNPEQIIPLDDDDFKDF